MKNQINFSLIEYKHNLAYYTIMLSVYQALPLNMYNMHNPILDILVRIRKIIRDKYGIDVYSELHVKEVDQGGDVRKVKINFFLNAASTETEADRCRENKKFQELIDQGIIANYLALGLQEFFYTNWYHEYRQCCVDLFKNQADKDIEKQLKNTFRLHMFKIGLTKPKDKERTTT